MPPKSPAAMLASVGLFEGLSKRELSQVQSASRDVEFPAGQVIVTEGESGVGFHMIVEGKVKVTIHGRRRNTLGPGSFFGELSLIDKGPRTATVTAETQVRTLSIASWEFLPLLDQNPGMARKILLEMCRRLRESERSHTH